MHHALKMQMQVSCRPTLLIVLQGEIPWVSVHTAVLMQYNSWLKRHRA